MQLIALAAIAACAPPQREVPPKVDLRVCVEDEASALLYRRHFTAATVAEPKGGRACDVAVSATTLNAGKVTVRSAYDGSTLAEIEGPVELAPQLVKIALDQGTEAYRRVWAQRTAAGRAR